MPLNKEAKPNKQLMPNWIVKIGLFFFLYIWLCENKWQMFNWIVSDT